MPVTVVERENNYDLLRIINCLFLLIIHAFNPQNTLVGQFVETFSGFVVPVFFMMSGAFSLPSYDCQYNIRRYYSKCLLRIIFPALAILIFCSYLDYKNFYFCSISKPEYIKICLDSIKKMGCSGRCYHLWFIPALVFCYAVSPLLIKLYKEKKNWYIFLTFLMSFWTVGGFYLPFSLPWYFRGIDVIGIYMLGFLLKNIDFNISKVSLLIVYLESYGMYFIIKAQLMCGHFPRYAFIVKDVGGGEE